MTAALQIDREDDLDHGVVHSDPDCYSAHPHLAVAADGTWLLVFTQAPRRPVVLHPPLDPAFRNMMMRSDDEGRTWSAPEPVPDAGWTGVECSGLTPLPDGGVILNQWQFGWVHPDTDPTGHEHFVAPPALARLRAQSLEFMGLYPNDPPKDLLAHFPKARRGGQCWIHRAPSPSAPFGASVEIDTWPFSGGYGMRGGVVLADGTILLPLCDVPHYRAVFVVRSTDGGQTWSAPQIVAEAGDQEFEEPAPVLLPDGRILLMLRENATRRLHAVWSNDGGRSWSPPLDTGIAEYPADIIVLADGRLAMAAGRRHPPFGVALYLSDTGGEQWEASLTVRDDLPNRDLGYPSIAERANGDLHVVYYGRDTSGATSILSTTVPRAWLGTRDRHDG
ncbi:exo-alpha-sialidase [Bauldia sp.]|uniref:exo-alpha-sialidase n=1 Tax=Bauldia sp. TaxID=2575872 RepID=UPI003BA8B376